MCWVWISEEWERSPVSWSKGCEGKMEWMSLCERQRQVRSLRALEGQVRMWSFLLEIMERRWKVLGSLVTGSNLLLR